MMLTQLNNILVIDDDPIIQSYLSLNLAKHGYKLIQLSCGEQIETVLKKQQIDLVILDIMLEGKDGLFWLDWLQIRYPDLAIIMLTAKTSPNDRVAGLELGAVDYLSKPFDIDELLLRMTKILQRSSITKETIVSFGEYRFDTQIYKLTKHNQLIKLTDRESELLEVLCQHRKKIVTRDQISQALNGNDHAPFDRRIDVHINHLRNKIEEDPSSPKYIRTVWGKGYQFYTL